MKNNHSEKSIETQKVSNKRKNDNSKDFEIHKEKKVENTKYIPQSLAVIKGKKYVVIKRPTVHQNFKKKPQDVIKKNKGAKSIAKEIISTNSTSSSITTASATAVGNITSTTNSTNSVALQNLNDNFCNQFLRNVSIGFEVLFHTFQYLTIKVTNIVFNLIIILFSNIFNFRNYYVVPVFVDFGV